MPVFDEAARFQYLNSTMKLHQWIGWGARRLLVFLSDSASKAAHILYNYRILVIGLAILYLILWLADQGQDLLLNLNTEWYGPISFLVTLVVLALLNWHLPKYFTDQAKNRQIEKRPLKHLFVPPAEVMGDRNRGERNAARMMGVLTFLIPACGIWNALQQFKVNFGMNFINPYLLLFVSIVVFATAFRIQFIGSLWEKYRRATGILITAIALLFLGVIVALPFSSRLSSPRFLVFMVLDLYLLAILFSLFVALRHHIKLGPIAYLNRKIVTIVIAAGCIFSVLFIVMNIYPMMMMHISRYITFGVVLTGVIFYSFVLTMLALASRRWRINIIFILILVGVLWQVSGVNNFHNIRMLSGNSKQPASGLISKSSLPSLDAYLEGWLQHRKDSINAWSAKKGKYPVFIVNTYGGGIRAAAWTTMVIAYMDEVMKQNYGKSFQHHTLAYSAVSGGTIGAALLCAQRYRYGDAQVLTADKVFGLYAKDYLTPVLIGLQGRDIWMAPFRSDAIADRAEFQERTWELHLQEDSIPFNTSYFRMWYDTTATSAFEVPLLFSNTYNADDGKKGILAPVKLNKNEFPGANFINDLYDTNIIDTIDENLRVSTAAFLSARFPYISPTARFADGLHFLDGGLKENSGAETASQLFRAIQRITSGTRDSSHLIHKVEFHILSIRNTFGNTEPDNKANNISEITAPLTGLVNNYVGTSIQADSVNFFELKTRYHTVHPRRVPIKPLTGDTLRPILPLGWQISDLALQGMRTSLANYPESLPRILVQHLHCDAVKEREYRINLRRWPEKK